ncbi:conserved Plasmodium membrane protein, unknown function [Plasmodium relictum]|uniref:Protease n=1 Tax=Plasmodium relictum TaxID=85471 RepID=A0A1J1H7U5_PLARL|nr:conserved Plasmodium membrane protein, unknown function [Plasmodium relictum]CRH00853.1 conserved Plasmodium membrane protein, unknown function [Plasmodium relictum]
MLYEELKNDNYEDEDEKYVKYFCLVNFFRLLYCFSSIIFLVGFSYASNGNKGIIYLIFSFSPSFFYLYLFKRRIRRKINFLHIVEMILYGAVLSTFFASVLEYFLTLYFFYFCSICFMKEIKKSLLFLCSIILFFYFFFIIAYVEEISKIIPMIFIYRSIERNRDDYIEIPYFHKNTYIIENRYDEEDRQKEAKMKKLKYIYTNDILEYVFFSLCSSAGFSSTENLLYAIQTTKENFVSILVSRNLICVLFHMCCSGLSSYNIFNYLNDKNKKSSSLNFIGILCSLFSSSLFHAIYDYSIYFTSLNVPLYQIFFLKILFMYCFLSMLLMFFVVIKSII